MKEKNATLIHLLGDTCKTQQLKVEQFEKRLQEMQQLTDELMKELGAQAGPAADGGAAEADAGEAGHHAAQDYDHAL
eukprot:9216157-Heterocapsa_arctica.AAC.1